MEDEKEVQVPEEQQAQDESSSEAEATPDAGQEAAADAEAESAEAGGGELPDISEGVDPIPEADGDEVAAEDMPPPEEDDSSPDEAAEENPQAEQEEASGDAEADDKKEFSDDEMAAMTDEEKAMFMTMDDVPEDSGDAGESGDSNESIGSNGLLSQEDLDAAIAGSSDADMGGTGGLLDSADIPQENEGKNLDLDSSASKSEPQPETPVNSAEFQQLSPASAGDKKPRNIDLLMDVDLPVSIELGRTRMNISDILSLGPGSVVELEKLVGEPVDLLVNQKTVARGEVVVVEENFGLRITELVSAEERIKNL